jgi:hypothetical protein
MITRRRLLTVLVLIGWTTPVAYLCAAQNASEAPPAASDNSPVPFLKSKIFSARNVPAASSSKRSASRFATTKGGVALGLVDSSPQARVPDAEAQRHFTKREIPQNQKAGLRHLRNETTLSEMKIRNPDLARPTQRGRGANPATGASRRPPEGGLPRPRPVR